MKYTTHYVDPIHGNFHITVDDETLAWTTNPPGQDIPKPLIGVRMSSGGPIGSGMKFDLFPGGNARLSMDR